MARPDGCKPTMPRWRTWRVHGDPQVGCGHLADHRGSHPRALTAERDLRLASRFGPPSRLTDSGDHEGRMIVRDGPCLSSVLREHVFARWSGKCQRRSCASAITAGFSAPPGSRFGSLIYLASGRDFCQRLAPRDGEGLVSLAVPSRICATHGKVRHRTWAAARRVASQASPGARLREYLLLSRVREQLEPDIQAPCCKALSRQTRKADLAPPGGASRKRKRGGRCDGSR